MPTTTVDDALIVVSELVANGVLHGGEDDVRLSLNIDGDVIRVEVTTSPPAADARVVAREPHEAGRGLAMVGACCEAVDVAIDPAGNRCVSCQIAIRPASGRGEHMASGRTRPA